ncbi:MAG TPA: hypothetical protein DD727_06290 [Clostridiales bacterium]|nr:hypothetical protein [Clostridiales bacterium]
MFSKNLKYYRLRKAISKKDLAERIHVSPMAISNYENGNRKPDMEILRRMAKELDIRVSDFLAVRNENLVFHHGEFRKNTALTAAQQEYVQESVEEYFNRFMTVVEVLGGEFLPASPQCQMLKLSGKIEADALSLRRHLKFAENGPIEDLIGAMENKGILIYTCRIDSSSFSGMNGDINGRPYIITNQNMTPERCRSTLAHELSHLMFNWPEDMPDAMIEETATAISGAFLFPKLDAVRELGVRRTAVAGDMLMTAQEYGISMFLLVKRARLCGIVNSGAEKGFYIQASKEGWRKNEPARIKEEKPVLFEQLVYRAVNENEISIQRGAELLKVSYDEIIAHCCFGGLV